MMATLMVKMVEEAARERTELTKKHYEEAEWTKSLWIRSKQPTKPNC